MTSYSDSDDDYEGGSLTLPKGPPRTMPELYKSQGKNFTLPEFTAQKMHFKMNNIDEKTFAMAEYFNERQDDLTNERDHFAEKYKIHNPPLVPGENEYRQCNANDLIFFDSADLRKNPHGKLDAKDKIIIKRLKSVPESQKSEIPFSRIQTKVLAKYICLDIELNAVFDKIWRNANLDLNSQGWENSTQEFSQKYITEYFKYLARVRYIKLQQRNLLFKAFSGTTTPWALCDDFVKNNVYYPTNKTDLNTGEVRAETRKLFKPSEKEKIAMTKTWTWNEWEKSVLASQNHNVKNMKDEENFSNTHQEEKNLRKDARKRYLKSHKTSSKSKSRDRGRGRSRDRESRRDRSRSRNQRSSSRSRRSSSRTKSATGTSENNNIIKKNPETTNNTSPHSRESRRKHRHQ